MINKEHIDELISKFLSGEATPEEAMLLEDWKEESAENRARYSQSEKMFALLHNHAAASEPDTEKAWQQVKPGLDKNKIRTLYPKTTFTRIAAALLFLLGIGTALVLVFNTGTKEAMIYTADKTAKEVKLSDGTEVTVFPNSSLIADKEFGTKNRLLHLKGNATFSVVHDEAIPFVIDAGNVFIKDIGTRFTVRSSLDTDTVYVKVDEGIVLLFDSLGSAIEIKATERALYIRSGKQIVKGGESAGIKQSTAISFSNERLGDVVAKLNTTYNTNILLENASLRDCTITTRFDKENLDTIMMILTETLGLTYEKTSTGYIIKGRTCHS